ncbi:MAG: glycosyltransferase family protein [Syntrophales bacterium]|nr:glycosyltransferase family protein [Syntrophales bacterium]MDD5642505.1 glycosyltransferase family protein [Syntrophales bacterium]
MAKILYSVHGTAHGHAIRALSIARRFPEHEFLFVSHEAGPAILEGEFPVVDIPSLGTVFTRHRVDTIATIKMNFPVWWERKAIFRRVLKLMDDFQPDAVISDYEFFLPRACRQLGLPCLSIDHQHVITACNHDLPWGEYPSYLVTALSVKLLFTRATDYLVISFFQPEVKPGLRAKILPPLLRDTVLAREGQDGDHVLVYQSYITDFRKFQAFVDALARPVIVYGVPKEGRESNLLYKKKSEEGFLEDLATCAYVVCGGGHSMISEALYYGKPVISFPIKGAFEQFLNALYIERLGYGRGITDVPHLEPGMIPAFEARLEEFRNRIRQANFCGNGEVFRQVQQFVMEGKLDY